MSGNGGWPFLVHTCFDGVPLAQAAGVPRRTAARWLRLHRGRVHRPVRPVGPGPAADPGGVDQSDRGHGVAASATLGRRGPSGGRAHCRRAGPAAAVLPGLLSHHRRFGSGFGCRGGSHRPLRPPRPRRDPGLPLQSIPLCRSVSRTCRGQHRYIITGLWDPPAGSK
jgi:hypothetical protein